MTREQYRRANKVVFPVMLIFLGYLAASMGLAALAGTAGWYNYVEMGTSLAGLIVVVVAFLAKKDTKLCGICMMGAGALVYMVFRIVGVSENTSIYAYPFLFAGMAYLNVKLLCWGNGVIVGANIIRLVMHLNSISGSNGSEMIMNILVSFLVACASIRIAQILVKFNAENMEEITEAAKKQKASNAVMVTVADNIIKHFGEAMERFDTLGESLKNSHTSMENIAGSTESTAEAIQEEASICGEILAQADQAGEATDSMIAASRRVNGPLYPRRAA